jgi:hypothetical protein
MSKKSTKSHRAFLIGAWVSWSSQAAGSRTTKTGVITQVVPAGAKPIGINGCGVGRNHQSYVVKVTPMGKHGPISPVLYWPRVSLLEPTEAPPQATEAPPQAIAQSAPSQSDAPSQAATEAA